MVEGPRGASVGAEATKEDDRSKAEEHGSGRE